MTALDHMRTICLALPDTTEGAHFGAVAFKVNDKLFATYHGGDDEHIVFGLDPDHADALIQNDPRFTRYARDPNALEIRVAQISDWHELRVLLQESYALRANVSSPAKKPAARKSPAKKPAANKSPAKKPAAKTASAKRKAPGKRPATTKASAKRTAPAKKPAARKSPTKKARPNRG